MIGSFHKKGERYRGMVAPQEHEYSVMGGTNRVHIGRMLTIVASTISSALVLLLLTVFDVAKEIGLNANVPPVVLSLVGAASVFGLLYTTLNKWAWRWPGANLALKVPNISGTWDCKGETLGDAGEVVYQWKGEIRIVQTWDKLRIRMRTKESGSNSIAAALAHDSIDGIVLLYHYRNDPKLGSSGLVAHTGCSVMTIHEDGMSASGEYFNGLGRKTCGTMEWKKRN